MRRADQWYDDPAFQAAIIESASSQGTAREQFLLVIAKIQEDAHTLVIHEAPTTTHLPPHTFDCHDDACCRHD